MQQVEVPGTFHSFCQTIADHLARHRGRRMTLELDDYSVTISVPRKPAPAVAQPTGKAAGTHARRGGPARVACWARKRTTDAWQPFESMVAAAKFLGCSKQSVCDFLHGRRTRLRSGEVARAA
jgi:hypothetical protein